MSEPLRILYENHRGETRERTLGAPIMIFRESRWHEGSQWLISAIDTESNAMRDFAVSGIRSQAQAACIAELEALVRDLRDPSPCDHFDHHGYCQTHGWLHTDPPCPHGRASKLLAAGSVEP